MTDLEHIASSLERLKAAVASRPGFGRGSATSVTVLTEGLRCTTRERSWEIDSDLGRAFGGQGAAPSPAALVRAALGACLAMGYRLWAAELGVEVTAVQVTVESDADVRGMLDLESCEARGFNAVRCHVEIDSPSPAALERVLDLSDRLSPVLDMLTRPHTVERTVTIRPVA